MSVEQLRRHWRCRVRLPQLLGQCCKTAMPHCIHTWLWRCLAGSPSLASPSFTHFPSTRLDHSRGGGLSKGPAEAYGARKSGAQRLRFRPVLRGDLWAPRPLGDEAFARPRQRGCRPWRCFAVVLRGGPLRELSVGLCRGNFMAQRASLGVLARSSGSAFWPGLYLPTDGHVE
jgi:hypothetical protein